MRPFCQTLAKKSGIPYVVEDPELAQRLAKAHTGAVSVPASPEPTMSVREAATQLGVTPQTIRNWLANHKLDGHQDGRKRVWRVTTQSVEAATPRTPGIRLSAASGDGIPAVRQMLEQLLARETSAERVLTAVERERDRYRADAAAVREAAIRVNRAADDLRQVIPSLVGVLEEQSDALAQLLGPTTPAELLRNQKSY